MRGAGKEGGAAGRPRTPTPPRHCSSATDVTLTDKTNNGSNRCHDHTCILARARMSSEIFMGFYIQLLTLVVVSYNKFL